MNNLLALVDGFGNELGQGGIISVVAIVLVFAILALIIGITYVVSLIIGKYSKKETASTATDYAQTKTVNIDSEEAEIAVLVASIDYRNETKKDVRLVSIKEIK